MGSIRLHNSTVKQMHPVVTWGVMIPHMIVSLVKTAFFIIHQRGEHIAGTHVVASR